MSEVPFPEEPPVPPSGTPAWYVRGAALPGGKFQVRCIIDEAQADGVVLDDPVEDHGMFLQWRAGLDGSGRPRMQISPLAVPGAPQMWFVDVTELDAEPPARSLVGFASGHLPSGTVVSNAIFFSMPVTSDQQAGAVRWWFEDGVVDQVYVAPEWRRRGVASLLLYTADAYHQFNGWPQSVHSDGRRTALGEALVAGLRFPERIAQLTEQMLPMDPENS
jgi:GNAT superfamily N-acetyltransferase